MGLPQCVRRRAGLVVVLVAGLLISSPAGADISNVVLQVVATSGRNSATIEITADQGAWVGDTFYWSSQRPIPITDGDRVLGTLREATLQVRSDPQVYLNFSVQAGDFDTDFVISSPLLSFSSIAGAAGRASAALTLMDFFDDGARLTGTGPTGGSYLAQYNGFVPGGTTFTEQIPLIEVVPPQVLAVASFEQPVGAGYAVIGPVSDMSAMFSFRLTAWDFASGSSNFEIVPEPAGLLLVGMPLLLLRRR
jgi:hypothetical protein